MHSRGNQAWLVDVLLVLPVKASPTIMKNIASSSDKKDLAALFVKCTQISVVLNNFMSRARTIEISWFFAEL